MRCTHSIRGRAEKIMPSQSKYDNFATIVFRVFIGVLGVAVAVLIVKSVISITDYGLSNLLGLVAGIYICFLFLAYALGGEMMAKKYFVFSKTLKKKNS